MLEQCKRSRNFFSSKGIPRYCVVTSNSDGQTMLSGSRNKRGKYRGPPNSKDLGSALKGCDDTLFLDFIRLCLDWDPLTRITPPQALRHPWLKRRLPRTPGGAMLETSTKPILLMWYWWTKWSWIFSAFNWSIPCIPHALFYYKFRRYHRYAALHANGQVQGSHRIDGMAMFVVGVSVFPIAMDATISMLNFCCCILFFLSHSLLVLSLLSSFVFVSLL